MTTKTITGAYAAGYDLKATFNGLLIQDGASVGGAGVTTSAYASIVNYGSVSGTTTGISLTHGEFSSNGYYDVGQISGGLAGGLAEDAWRRTSTILVSPRCAIV
jgi:hypothetical protein